MRRTNGAEHFQLTPGIGSIPMNSVVALVLIAFVALTPLVTVCGPPLPRARMAAPFLANGVTLGIDREGRFYLRDGNAFELLPPPRLSARLAEAYAGRPDDHVLYLRADQDAAYAHVLTAVDAAREAGVSRFEILADPPREPRGL